METTVFSTMGPKIKKLDDQKIFVLDILMKKELSETLGVFSNCIQSIHCDQVSISLSFIYQVLSQRYNKLTVNLAFK